MESRISEYLLEYVHDMVHSGIDRQLVKEEVLNLWDISEDVVDEIINHV